MFFFKFQYVCSIFVERVRQNYGENRGANLCVVSLTIPLHSNIKCALDLHCDLFQGQVVIVLIPALPSACNVQALMI